MMNELNSLQNIKDYALIESDLNTLDSIKLNLLFDLAYVMGEKHQLEEQLKN
jgi:hypothetical protein